MGLPVPYVFTHTQRIASRESRVQLGSNSTTRAGRNVPDYRRSVSSNSVAAGTTEPIPIRVRSDPRPRPHVNTRPPGILPGGLAVRGDSRTTPHMTRCFLNTIDQNPRQRVFTRLPFSGSPYSSRLQGYDAS